jgi:hypothetical protein
MRFGRQSSRSPATIPFEAALLAWVPIALGIVMGTVTRLVVFVSGGSKTALAIGSILCAGLGATVAVLWLAHSGEEPGWLGAIKLSATWVLLSAAFRALWIGIVIGGGWTGVTTDYHMWDGQPWTIIVALIAVAPLLMEWTRRKAESPR